MDTSIECSGATVAIHTAIKATRNGGVVVLVGMGAPEISLPLVDAAVREVDIIGVFRYLSLLSLFIHSFVFCICFSLFALSFLCGLFLNSK